MSHILSVINLIEDIKDDILSRGIPALKHRKTGQIIIGQRGKPHNYSLPERVYNYHNGYYDPKTKKFHPKVGEGGADNPDDVVDIDSTDLMTPHQRARYYLDRDGQEPPETWLKDRY